MKRLFPLSLLLCSILFSFAPRAGTVYSLGVIPQFNPTQLIAIWMPILDELERRTGLKFDLDLSEGIPEFERRFLDGGFDFAYANPYQFVTANRTPTYRALVRDGGRLLHGILVVPVNSPIHSVAELDGKQVAFPSPRALAASLLMRADLDAIHGIDVEPVYVRSHSAVYDSVLLGYAAAGSGVMATLRGQGPRAQQVLRVLYQTRGLPPHPLAANLRVPERDREAVRRALLEMAATEEGAELLERIPVRRLIRADNNDYLPLEEWGLRDYFDDN